MLAIKQPDLNGIIERAHYHLGQVALIKNTFVDERPPGTTGIHPQIIS